MLVLGASPHYNLERKRGVTGFPNGKSLVHKK